MSIHREIDQIKINMKRFKFQNELDYLKSNRLDDNNTDWIQSRIEKLELIIQQINEDEEVFKRTKKNNVKDMFIEIDKYIYKKPWSRLTNFHKINRITEFVNDNIDETRKEYILNELVTMVNDKKLNTKNKVDYDSQNCKIIKIKVLKEKDGVYSITK